MDFSVVYNKVLVMLVKMCDEDVLEVSRGDIEQRVTRAFPKPWIAVETRKMATDVISQLENEGGLTPMSHTKGKAFYLVDDRVRELHHDSSPAWSVELSPKKWRSILRPDDQPKGDISQDTFSRMINRGDLRTHPESTTKRVRIDLRCLTPTQLELYKNRVSSHAGGVG